MMFKSVAAATLFATMVSATALVDEPVLTCGTSKTGIAYKLANLDDEVNSGRAVGTCETTLDSDLFVIISTDFGNKCGTCVQVTMNKGKSKIVEVFDHIDAYAGEEKNGHMSMTTSLFSYLGGTGYTNDVEWIEVPCPAGHTSPESATVQFSDDIRTAIRFSGVPANIVNMDIILEGSTDVISLERRSKFSDYWTVPIVARKKKFHRFNLY